MQGWLSFSCNSLSSFCRGNLWSEAQIDDWEHLSVSHSQKNDSMCLTVPWHGVWDLEGCIVLSDTKGHHVPRPLSWWLQCSLLACFVPVGVLRRFGLCASLTCTYTHLSHWEYLKECARSCTWASAQILVWLRQLMQHGVGNRSVYAHEVSVSCQVVLELLMTLNLWL